MRMIDPDALTEKGEKKASYIDRDKLIKELSMMYKFPTSTEDFMTIGYDHAIADVVVTVHEQPTADVAEIVRCKDCALRSNGKCDVWSNLGVTILTAETGYCNFGERRDDGDE